MPSNPMPMASAIEPVPWRLGKFYWILVAPFETGSTPVLALECAITAMHQGQFLSKITGNLCQSGSKQFMSIVTLYAGMTTVMVMQANSVAEFGQ